MHDFMGMFAWMCSCMILFVCGVCVFGYDFMCMFVWCGCVFMYDFICGVCKCS